MQSIEHALGNVEHDIMDKVADDWMANNPQRGNPNVQGVSGAPQHYQGGLISNERLQQGMHQHAMHVPSSH